MLGQALGLTDEEFDALQGGYRASSLFNQREKAVLAWSEAMTLNTAKRDQAAWEELRRLFSDVEIVEISLACAMFNMINRLNDAFRTDLEPEEHHRKQHEGIAVTAAVLEDFACRICAAERPGRQLTLPEGRR